VLRLFVIAFVVLAVANPSAPSTSAGASCSWRVLATPRARLTAVAAVSPSDVWVVGWTGTEDHPRGVIGRWDGVRLRLTPLPRGESLSSIAAVSASDVWAVGDETVRGDLRSLAQHWNGRHWHRLSRFNGVASLSDIAMQSRTSGWAVGGTTDTRPIVLRWNGRFWRKQVLVDRPHEGWLSAVAAATPRNVWAVGQQGGGINTQDGLALHWRGRRWRSVPAPNRDDSDLGFEATDEFDDVAAVSRSEAWAIHSALVRTDIDHWNGRRWRIVRVFPSAITLQGVIAFHDEAWALGGRSGRPFLFHWNGRSWRSSALGGVHGDLAAASALSPTMIWAGGSRLFAQYTC
jgi:hypothetical protein